MQGTKLFLSHSSSVRWNLCNLFSRQTLACRAAAALHTQRHFLSFWALLFRDNDKALNPSVDLTFVPPPLFLNCLLRWGAAIWPLLEGLGVCLGRGDFRSPPLFGLATPQPPHSCRQNPCLIYQIPKIIMCCLLWSGEKVRAREERRKKERFTFVWGGLWGFEVGSLRHVTDVLSNLTEMFTFDFSFQTLICSLLDEIMSLWTIWRESYSC